MNKAELVTALAERLDGDRKAATAAVDGLLEVIVRTVQSGDSVSLTGFGVFERRERAARSGRNPRTGQVIQVPATAVPAFRPGASFRNSVSGVRADSAPAPAARVRTRAAAPVPASAAAVSVPAEASSSAIVVVEEEPAKGAKADKPTKQSKAAKIDKPAKPGKGAKTKVTATDTAKAAKDTVKEAVQDTVKAAKNARPAKKKAKK